MKNSELNRSDDDREYKGRVVFRGDTVRDETGAFAVFSEQSASASHLAACKMLDAIARFPGCSGEDSDADSAYTQVPWEEFAKLLGLEGGKELLAQTYIALPESRRPKSWSHIKDLVCLLKRNLYGHPLAGLVWEKFATSNIFVSLF